VSSPGATAITRDVKATVFAEALPWLKHLHGKIVVVKYGGHAMVHDRLRRAFAADMVFLRNDGRGPGRRAADRGVPGGRARRGAAAAGLHGSTFGGNPVCAAASPMCWTAPRREAGASRRVKPGQAPTDKPSAFSTKTPRSMSLSTSIR
jgi:hypothetical protein